jgi:hypothetical protein
VAKITVCVKKNIVAAINPAVLRYFAWEGQIKMNVQLAKADKCLLAFGELDVQARVRR